MQFMSRGLRAQHVCCDALNEAMGHENISQQPRVGSNLHKNCGDRAIFANAGF